MSHMPLNRPLGVILGLLVLQFHGFTALIFAATLQSLSAGVFIYITFMSLIPAEFIMDLQDNDCALHYIKEDIGNGAKEAQGIEGLSKSTIYWKLLAFTCGWAIMAILSFIA